MSQLSFRLWVDSTTKKVLNLYHIGEGKFKDVEVISVKLAGPLGTGCQIDLVPSFYPGGVIPDHLDYLQKISSPVLMHLSQPDDPKGRWEAGNWVPEETEETCASHS